jgi:hypothetical protein
MVIGGGESRDVATDVGRHEDLSGWGERDAPQAV